LITDLFTLVVGFLPAHQFSIEELAGVADDRVAQSLHAVAFEASFFTDAYRLIGDNANDNRVGTITLLARIGIEIDRYTDSIVEAANMTLDSSRDEEVVSDQIVYLRDAVFSWLQKPPQKYYNEALGNLWTRVLWEKYWNNYQRAVLLQRRRDAR